MSIKIMSAVWDLEGIDGTECLVLLALADHADDEGRCYPSIPRLARRTKLSERGVRKVLSRLSEVGLVTVDVGAGRAGSNLYQIVLTPEPCSGGNHVQGGTTFHTPLNHVPKPPEPRSAKPSRTTIEPSEEPLVVPQPDEPPSKRRRSTSLPPDWAPSGRNIADAHSRNFTDEEVQHEAERFRDYHLAKGTTFRDWDAGWKTWLGNSRRFGSSGQMARGSQYGGGKPVGGLVGAALRSEAARGH